MSWTERIAGRPAQLVGRGRARLLVLAAGAWWALVIARYFAQLWRGSWYGGDELPGLYLDLTLPALREALMRGAAGLGGAALLVASAVVVGRQVSRLAGWRYAGAAEELPIVASLGFGLYAYLGLALAAAGLYRPTPLVALGVAPGLVAGAMLALRRRPELGAAARRLRLPRRGERLWAVCAGLAMACALVAGLAPEREYDAAWYHLSYPMYYLAAGRLVDLPHDYVSLYPMTWELWFGYGMALGGPVAAKLLHFACLPLAGLATYALARRAAPAASPWLAVALFATIPTVIWEASTAYIDLALALHMVVAIYALLRHLERRERQWLLIGALSLGLAVATKHLALFALAICGLGLLLTLWRRERRLWPALAASAALGALALLPALPWYARAYLASGNPVFPELFGLFGAPPERWDATALAGLSRFLAAFGPQTTPELLLLPWHMTVHAEAYHGTLGPLFLLLLPALALRRMRGSLRLIALFSLAYLALWASPSSSFQMRFLVPITPLLAVLGAAAIRHLASLTRRAVGTAGPRLLAGAVALLLLLNLPPFTALHEVDRVGWQGWLNNVLRDVPVSVVVGGETADSFLRRNVRSYAVWQHANAALPPEARVLSWANGDQLYSRRDRIWAYATVMRPAVWAGVGEAEIALAGLREQGITHVILDKSLASEWEQHAVSGAQARAEWYTLLYEDRFYALYALRWDQLGARS
jgi:hypothetical protein